ncbi:MAG TPA: amidohydrolase family protein [Pseudolysinimonas sp.]|nr:amidohydrolase family protein [Pseudolysinimonas sp.]
MTPADLVFTGGSLFTAGAAESFPGAVAVRAGEIVAVGTADEVAPLIGPATEVVDTTGRLLLPGFQDAHVHPVQAGVELLQCDLTGARDAAECLERIGAYAAANPGEPWILGAGWSMEFFEGGTPTAAALDAVVSDRPVLLSNRDHHGAWVNSRALEVAGITADTPDPADGRIERAADGTPTGTLHEGAVGLVAALRPAPDDDLQYRGLLRAQQHLLSLGITSWQDALVGSGLGMPDAFPVYLRAIAEGTLIARVAGALWWERERGIEQLPGLLARRDRIAGLADAARMQMGTVKLMVDGVAENFTAAITSPYLDADGEPTDNAGLSFIAPAALAEYATALDAAGFDLHFHALGDRAVREALDAIEAARAANGATASRQHLAHLQIVAEGDVPRFAGLGAVANLQPLWACHEPQLDELTLPFLQPELAGRQYPFGDLARSGARFAAGSDWPVSSADPLAGIRVAVTRLEPDAEPGTPPLGGLEQALDLATAFTAYTAGGAYVNRREDSTGRLEPGYRADLVVLDRDPFDGPPELLDDTRVLGTWVDGRRVYDSTMREQSTP